MKIIKFILKLLLGTLLVVLLLYFFIIKGEEYKTTKEFIFTNDQIKNICGEIKNIYLIVGYAKQTSNESGHAMFRIYIRGNKKNGSLFIELKIISMQWKVIRAELVLKNREILKLK